MSFFTNGFNLRQFCKIKFQYARRHYFLKPVTGMSSLTLNSAVCRLKAWSSAIPYEYPRMQSRTLLVKWEKGFSSSLKEKQNLWRICSVLNLNISQSLRMCDFLCISNKWFSPPIRQRGSFQTDQLAMSLDSHLTTLAFTSNTQNRWTVKSTRSIYA